MSRTLYDVVDAVQEWGLDYTFAEYSEFSDVKDEKFHELREKYLDGYLDLRRYLSLKTGVELD